MSSATSVDEYRAVKLLGVWVKVPNKATADAPSSSLLSSSLQRQHKTGAAHSADEESIRDHYHYGNSNNAVHRRRSTSSRRVQKDPIGRRTCTATHCGSYPAPARKPASTTTARAMPLRSATLKAPPDAVRRRNQPSEKRSAGGAATAGVVRSSDDDTDVTRRNAKRSRRRRAGTRNTERTSTPHVDGMGGETVEDSNRDYLDAMFEFEVLPSGVRQVSCRNCHHVFPWRRDSPSELSRHLLRNTCLAARVGHRIREKNETTAAAAAVPTRSGRVVAVTSAAPTNTAEADDAVTEMALTLAQNIKAGYCDAQFVRSNDSDGGASSREHPLKSSSSRWECRYCHQRIELQKTREHLMHLCGCVGVTTMVQNVVELLTKAVLMNLADAEDTTRPSAEDLTAARMSRASSKYPAARMSHAAAKDSAARASAAAPNRSVPPSEDLATQTRLATFSDTAISSSADDTTPSETGVVDHSYLEQIQAELAIEKSNQEFFEATFVAADLDATSLSTSRRQLFCTVCRTELSRSSQGFAFRHAMDTSCLVERLGHELREQLVGTDAASAVTATATATAHLIAPHVLEDYCTQHVPVIADAKGRRQAQECQTCHQTFKLGKPTSEYLFHLASCIGVTPVVHDLLNALRAAVLPAPPSQQPAPSGD